MPVERKWLSLYCTDFVALTEDAFQAGSIKPHPTCGTGHFYHESSRGVSRPFPESEASLTSAQASSGATEGTDEAAGEAEQEHRMPPEVFLLPDSIVRNIFERLDAEALSCAAQTCIAWRAIAYEPALWRALALKTWTDESPKQVERLLWTAPPPGPYLTWRRLLIHRPHLRSSGIYVMRHQYAKSRGAAVNQDGSVAPPVFLVTYWRLIRFYPDGTLVALTTPDAPERALKRLRRGWEPPSHETTVLHPSVGKYTFFESARSVEVTLPVESKLHPRAMKGFQHLTFSLATSHPGAFDRLYLRDHFAIMEDGSVVTYQEAAGGHHFGKAWRFVPLNGFTWRVYEHFPREAAPDGSLEQWRESF